MSLPTPEARFRAAVRLQLRLSFLNGLGIVPTPALVRAIESKIEDELHPAARDSVADRLKR